MKHWISLLLVFFGCCCSSFAQEWKLYYDSSKIVGQYDWVATVDLLQKALPLLDKSEKNYEDVLLQIKGDLGLASLNAGDIENAVKTLSEVASSKKNKFGLQHKETLITQINLAEGKIKSGKLEQAESILKEIIAVNKTSIDGHLDLFLQSHLKLALLYETMSRYQEAEQLYQELSKKEKSSAQTALISHQQGNFYYKLGKYSEGKTLLVASNDFYAQHRDKHTAQYIESANSLIRLFITLGTYKKAEKSLINVFDITKNFIGPKRIVHANTLSNLANLYRQLGNYDKAESYYMDMMQIYQALNQNETQQYATALNNLANLFGALGQYENAEKMYHQAGKIYLETNGEFSRPYANLLNNLAGLYRKSGKLDKAEAFYKKCLEIDSKTIGLFHPDYATILNNLGILQTIKGKHDQAKSSFVKALKIRLYTLGEKHASYTNSLNNLALLHMMENDLASATPLLKKGIENHLLQLKTVFPMLSEKEKETFYNMVKSDFERFNTFVVKQHKESPELIGFLYNIHLATKSMLFRATDRMKRSILASDDVALISDYKRWKRTKEILAFYYQLPKNQIANRLAEIQSMEVEANNLEKSISLKSSDFAKEVSQNHYNWKQIQSQLKQGEAAIEIVRFRDYNVLQPKSTLNNDNSVLPKSLIHGFTNKVKYAALILTAETKEQPLLVVLDEGKAMEEDYYSFYQNAIKFGLPDNDSYKRYWLQIEKQIPNIDKIYFSPDGIYNVLNINTLFDVKSKQYLLEKVDICLVTNTYELLVTEKATSLSKSALIMGDPNFDLLPKWREKIDANEDLPTDTSLNLKKEGKDFYGWLAPLPGTSAEILSVDSLLTSNGWETEIKQKNHATELSIKKTKSPFLVHIATHGFFDEKTSATDSLAPDITNNPLLRTGLMLTGANVSNYRKAKNIENSINVDDGILTAYEAMNLDLNETELVILSACETGLGEIKHGEGVFGLQRAFRVAGAKNIMISLRKVNDQATKMLITDFYKRWLASGDIRTSFKQAQIALQKTFPSPYFWGSFVLISGI